MQAGEGAKVCRHRTRTCFHTRAYSTRSYCTHDLYLHDASSISWSTMKMHSPRSSFPRRPARPLIWMYSPDSITLQVGGGGEGRDRVGGGRAEGGDRVP